MLSKQKFHVCFIAGGRYGGECGGGIQLDRKISRCRSMKRMNFFVIEMMKQMEQLLSVMKRPYSSGLFWGLNFTHYKHLIISKVYMITYVVY
jgi:hypothetical protein